MKHFDSSVKLIVPLVRDRRLSPILKPLVEQGIKVSRDPMVISGYRRDEVSILHLSVLGNAVYTYPEFNTYGASVNMIRMCMLDEENTIPKHLIKQMNSMKNIQEVNRTFGDSIEKVLHIKSLMDIKPKEVKP